jgi:hypothetical protein
MRSANAESRERTIGFAERWRHRRRSAWSLRRQPDRALSEVGATKAIAHRGNVGSGCVRCEVTLDRVTSGTVLVLNNTNRDEAKQRLAILTFVEE